MTRAELARRTREAEELQQATQGKGRVGQITGLIKITARNDPQFLPWVLGAFLLPLVICVLIGVLTGHIVALPILGVLLGALAAVAVFGRRAQHAQLAQVQDLPGVAASLVEGMRGTWKVTPMVQFTKQQDFVHRVIGRPGVVLLVEAGSDATARTLQGNEERRLRKVIGDVPLTVVRVGNGEGQVPLRKLTLRLSRLPRKLRAVEVEPLDRRLKALTQGPPIPKGVDPTRVKRPRIR
jgi:hypothetical protein